MSLFYNSDLLTFGAQNDFNAFNPGGGVYETKTSEIWSAGFATSGISTNRYFSGENIIYDSIGMIGGTITYMSYVDASRSSFINLSISGGLYSAATIQSLALAGNEEAYWSYLTSGNDTFVAASGNDIIRAGTGNDTVYVTGSGDKTIFGGTGSNNIYSGVGNDVIVAGNLTSAALDAAAWSVVYGGAGNDFIVAGYGSNAILHGGMGHDKVIDGFGTDILESGEGFDYLAAGTGTNYLMFGGDAFVGGQYDQIDYFTASAGNYIGIAAGWAPYMHTAQYGSTASLNWQTADGSYYSIYVYNATVEQVTSHLFTF